MILHGPAARRLLWRVRFHRSERLRREAIARRDRLEHYQQLCRQLAPDYFQHNEVRQ